MKRYSLLFLSFVILTGVAVAGDTYSLSVDNSIDIREQTVEIEGTEHEISEIGEYEPGESIIVTVTGPEDAIVQLRDSDRFIQDFERLSSGGSQQITFETSSLDPGTYAIALDVGGTYEEVIPVVISGYDLSVTAPASAATDETITLSVDLKYEALTETPEAVEIALWNDNNVFDVTAESVGNQTYQADIDLDSISPGEYHVDATAVDDEAINGFPSALAIGTGESIMITKADDEKESDDEKTGDSAESDNQNGDNNEESDDGTDNEESDGEEIDEEESGNEDEVDVGGENQDVGDESGDEENGDEETDDEETGGSEESDDLQDVNNEERDENEADDGEESDDRTDNEESEEETGDEEESGEGENQDVEEEDHDEVDDSHEEESDRQIEDTADEDSDSEEDADQEDEDDNGDDIIDPNDGPDEKTDADDDGPGFNVTATVVSLLGIGFFFRRRVM